MPPNKVFDLKVGGRKRLDEEQAQALERKIAARGNAVAGQVVERLDVQTPALDVSMQTSSSCVRRRGGKVRRRRTIYLPPDLDKRLADYCHGNGREVSETIAAAVEVYLAAR